MSLIGDALRRKQEDGPATSTPETPVVTPPPEIQREKPRSTLSLRGREEEHKSEPESADTESAVKSPKKRPHKKFKAWIELVVVIVGLMILTGLGVVLYFMYFATPGEPAPSTPVAASLPSTPESPVIAPPEPAPAPPPASEPEPPSPASDENISSASSEPEPTPVPVPPAQPVTAPPPPDKKPPEATVESKPPPVMWPSFSLQAAMGSGPRGSVLINGQIISTGSKFGDITILEVTPQGVIMEFEGERRTFRVRR